MTCEIEKEILELQQDIFYHYPDLFCQIFGSTKENSLSLDCEVKICK